MYHPELHFTTTNSALSSPDESLRLAVCDVELSAPQPIKPVQATALWLPPNSNLESGRGKTFDTNPAPLKTKDVAASSSVRKTSEQDWLKHEAMLRTVEDGHDRVRNGSHRLLASSEDRFDTSVTPIDTLKTFNDILADMEAGVGVDQGIDDKFEKATSGAIAVIKSFLVRWKLRNPVQADSNPDHDLLMR
jgi:hypothetical protein